MSITVYTQPIKYIVLEIILIPVMWVMVSLLVSRRSELDRPINALILFAAILLIVHSTLLNRVSGARSGVVSLPFQQFIASIRDNREILRSLLLNILLFCPFGAAFVNLFSQHKPSASRVSFACILGMLLSLLIEWIQYHFSLGNAEADDVICNTLGTFIGALSLPIKTAIAAARNIEKER